MFVLIVAMALGGVLAAGAYLGPGPAALANGLFSVQVGTAHGVLLSVLGHAVRDPAALNAAAWVSALLAPGLVCLCLVELCRGAQQLRRPGSVLVFLAACTSFFFVPASHAAALVVSAAVLSFLLWSAVGSVLVALIAASSGFLTVQLVMVILGGQLPQSGSTAAALEHYVDLGSYAHLVLGLVAFLPVAAAVGRLLNRQGPEES